MCLKKKKEKKKKRKPFFLFVAPLLSPFPCDECPFIKRCCTTFSQRRGMIMICALSDYYQGDILEVFKKGDLKVTKKNNACCKCGSQINSSSLPLLRLYIKVLNESWLTRGEWHEPVLSTSVSLWSFSPNKETRLNSEQLPSLIFRSPGREHCSLCLCPQLDSTPWVCKLIKKLGRTISLTRWRAIVGWWCAWYSMGPHYD